MRAFIIEINDLFALTERKPQDVKLFDKNKRQLVIPMYQREFVWSTEKIDVLLRDIAQRDKFLGNLILDEKDACYHIVDGQQRITTCFLTLVCLYNRYAGQNKMQQKLMQFLKPVNGFCLKNESIGDFLSEDGDKLSLDIDQTADVYFQKETFDAAMRTIEQFVQELSDDAAVKDFREKLLKSKVLVLINDNDPITRSIEQIFLDINEKAALLEPEDIFKGYCFKNTDVDFHEELRTKWVLLRKCGADFVKFGFKDLSEYLYVFLLVTRNKDLSQKLYLKGKHILEGKTTDDTFDLIDEMIDFGTSVQKCRVNLNKVDYRFDDLCTAAKSHGNTDDHLSLKAMCIHQLTYSGSIYQKIPLMCLVYVLSHDVNISNALSYDKFRRIVSNLYIYSVLFLLSGGRKSKGILDNTVYKAFTETAPFDEKVVLEASKNLRANNVREFAMPDNLHTFEILANLYSIMDSFDCNAGWVKSVYSRESNHNLEHFIAPDNRGALIEWHENGDIQSIQLDKETVKHIKKLTINYLIIDETLNENMRSYDVVQKIDMIRLWFANRNASLPKHIEVILGHIERLQSYQALKALKGTNAEKDVIEKKYSTFLAEFSSDSPSALLLASLSDAFKKAFTN